MGLLLKREKPTRRFMGPVNRYGYGYGGATKNRNAGLALELANYQLEGENLDGAYRFLMDAISIEPDNYGPYLTAGVVALGMAVKDKQKDMFGKSIQLFEKGLSLDPDPDTKNEFEAYLKRAKDLSRIY